MSSNCCRLGRAINQDRVLCQTSNFFVIPTLGPIGIEGYLLIVPKKHYLGFAEVPPKLYPELNELLSSVKGIIKSEYKKPALIFEHGPRVGKPKSGQSIDHAHLHVVPGIDITKDWALDLMSRLKGEGLFYRVERVEGFEKGKILLERGVSYLYVENLDGWKLLSEQNFNRPSQYFRKMVANYVNPNAWNWKRNPDRETLEKTVERLKGRI
ncbi:MAG: HIT domain-containing protein [Candidatus Nanoarchaeia archaeon]|nr:HIT domain-containing protein [Candidatus Nanoarchaeia archaeon]MDD5740763.1 HIT domain-containing protein [Candidatus Nanoarchaeia archaeon]